MFAKIKDGVVLGVGVWIAFQILNILLSLGMYALYLLLYTPPNV